MTGPHCLTQAVITSLTLVSLVSSELYHIVPYDSPSLCMNYTDGSCITLAQFANRTLASDVTVLTLVFLPGDHVLSQTINISNIPNVTLIGSESKQPTIKNYGHTIDFKNISFSFYIANLNIIREEQTALSIEYAKNVLIKNCLISGSDAQATQHCMYSSIAISVVENILISKTDFKNNQMFVAEYNHNLSLGGSALSVVHSKSILMKDSSFFNNFVRRVNISAHGGGLLLVDIKTVTIINCIMKNNTVLCYGCQVATGGAISLLFVYSVIVIDTTFDKNAVLNNLYQSNNANGFGGAIYFK